MPRTKDEIVIQFRKALETHQRRYNALDQKRSYALTGIVLAFVMLAYLAFDSIHSAAPIVPMLLCSAAIIGLIWYSLRLQPQLTRCQRLIGFYERALQRVDGTEPQSGRTGTEAGQDLRQPGHLYDRDLDILGPDSLFGLLATVRTGPGERGLARYLLEPATHAETLERQAAVKELLPQTSLREEIALLGATSFHQISASFFDEWLDDQPPTFNPIFRIVLLITAVLNVLLLLTGLTHLRPWGWVMPNLALVLAIQGSISLVLRQRVMPLLTASARLQHHIRLFSDGLAVLQRTSFTCPKLTELQRQALEPAGAVKLLKQLESQLAIVEQRTKEYFLILSLLLAAGTQAAMSISKWKHAHAAAMRQWLTVWAEFEALNALAAYAFENPEDAWPELLPPTHAPHYSAAALGHPLLPNAVTNNLTLSLDSVPHSSRSDEWDPATEFAGRFFLISGSNMAGKSTLLRSIGINAVLAYAGAPVRAQSLSLTPLAIGASLALTDSLAEGRSKFLAEVERLSAIVAASRNAPTLFLVDEIFSGTNSEDRRTAARAVLEALLANQAIGALSTHDLALTALANSGNTGLNVHMASPDPDDPLAFDYKLKPGINTASNALAIVRMMGLQA
jgi:hypothetical protein